MSAPHAQPLERFAFGGPWGALGLTLGLPFAVCYLSACLLDHGGALFVPASGADWLALLPQPTWQAAGLFAGWLGLQALLQLLLPGKLAAGQPLEDGSRLTYRMNGLLAFGLTLALVGGAVALGWLPAGLYRDLYRPLLACAVLFAFAYSGYLYWHGLRHGRNERRHGHPLHDFFLGTSLNPRTRGFDHKLFCEARPGLMLWVLGDLSLAAAQLERHGNLSTPMILVCGFQLFYVADYYLHEEAILTTWDIKHENFGFMLAFGDLVWVPFTYTFQALYLVEHAHDLPWWGTAGIVALNVAGYLVFRGANRQKHRFRTRPSATIWGKPPEVLETARGTPLLVSGWWGLARHINYLGDLMMALAWCLPCLFGHVTPYFYVIYFTLLLVLRERRDHATCKIKYGADWDRYCARVRWRIVPFVY